MLSKMISDTTLALEGIQISLNLLARVVIVGRIALVFLLVGQGEVLWAKVQSPPFSA